MAKQQTFGDKLKKKKVSDDIDVRVIQGLESELRGTYRFINRMIKIKDMNELTTIDLNKLV